jgi:hypothetical protein
VYQHTYMRGLPENISDCSLSQLPGYPWNISFWVVIIVADDGLMHVAEVIFYCLTHVTTWDELRSRQFVMSVFHTNWFSLSTITEILSFDISWEFVP